MATDYTTNYHLDKYTALDKPNLRDQYNAAMDKIDLGLLSANTNAAEAKHDVHELSNIIDNLQIDKPIVLIVTDSYGNTLHSSKSFIGYLTDWCKGHIIKGTYINGGGFNDGNFYAYFNTLVNSLSDTEKNQVKYVFFVGGHNDADDGASQAALNSAVATCKALIDNSLPNAVGILSHVGSCVQGRSVHASDTFTKICTNAERWKVAATANGMVADDNAQYTLCMLDMFSNDYVHPNEKGQQTIAARIMGILNGVNSVRGTGNQVKYHNNTDGTITYIGMSSVNPVVTDSSNVMYLTFNGSDVNMQIGLPNSFFVLALDENHYIAPDSVGRYYGKIGEHSIPCVTGKWFSVPISGILTLEVLATSERFYPHYSGSLIFNPNGDLYFKTALPNKAMSGYAASTCTTIRFYPTGGLNYA